jgi:hypothetical protein
MRAFNIGLGMLRGFATVGVAAAALVVLSACASPVANVFNDGGSSGANSSGGSSGANSSGGSSGSGSGSVSSSDASTGIVLRDATVSSSSSGSSSGSTPSGPQSVDGSVADCQGCTFPPPNAPSCASSAPVIKVVYPNDNVLVPPNMNVISVQWTPFGSAFKDFEVDFSQTIGTATTDWRIVTACATQTVDAQSGTPSGGCEVTVDPLSWSNLVEANRGASNPISITVRGTTDGTCASTSTNTVHLSIAEQDLLGTYYYWKSTVSANGVGGQIFAKTFGDLNTPEQDVTTTAIQNATCNGCHSLSRDGSRMVIYSDDDDSDDEYSDVAGSYLDMTPLPANPATEFPGGITGVRQGGQPPGFSAIDPLASFYVSSNGYPLTAAGKSAGSSNGYPTAVPTNGWSVWNGTNGTFIQGVAIGPTGQRPTMPDWSIDGKTLVYVQPAAVAQYDGTNRNDDMHMFGGSLYTVSYNGGGTFGAPAVFLQSNGENNYYPSYSPDVPMSFIIFNRVDSAGASNACSGGFCPNDSFSNPAARLMLIGASAAGSAPIDLEKANGSSASAKVPLSNSYPRWAPFVQSYHGNKLLWFTFSSTRDYGVRVLNHKMGMYQCYPADAAETPGGAHNGKFATQCQEPQLWMAPITFTEAQSGTVDPSGVAFWVPYQDIATHNHTAQWTQQVPQPMPDAGTPACTCGGLLGACGPANGGCPCCSGQNLVCSGNSQCIQVAN